MGQVASEDTFTKKTEVIPAVAIPVSIFEREGPHYFNSLVIQ